MASIIPNSQFSKIFNPQDDSIPMAQKTKISSPVAINQNPVIRTAGMFMEPIQPNQLSLSLMSQSTTEPQDDESGRFLASLIAQGAAGFGTGMMGGSAADIQRSAGTFQTMRDTQENQRRAKQLTDPNSEESKRRREVYKSLGFQVPNNLSATDLNDPTVLQTLKGQMEQSRLAVMPKGGGGVSGVGKPEKEIKSNQKSMAEYREHVASLAEMGNVLDKIKLLNRTGIGTITPDFSVNTQAYSSSLDRAAQPMIKTLAGPGTLQKEERDTYGKLVPTGNTRADLALRQANDIILEGTQKSLTKMNTDLNTGDISKRDYDALINEYNEQLSKKGIGINQIINPNTGRLEPRTKSEVELKDGRKAIVDQFGYTWE